jgi:hypothetical protein
MDHAHTCTVFVLPQVLKLELALEEGSIARSELQQQVAQLTAERDQVSVCNFTLGKAVSLYVPKLRM